MTIVKLAEVFLLLTNSYIIYLVLVSDAYSVIDPEILNQGFDSMSVSDAMSRFDFKPRIGRDPYGTDWNRYCRSIGVHFYPTSDYSSGLADYLKERCSEIVENVEGAPRILEAGAGRGRLSFLLNKSFNDLGLNVSILPVDNLSWRSPVGALSISDNIDVIEALEHFKPNIVLTAWPPIIDYEKWYRAFRNAPSVLEHIFIGEPEQSMGTGANTSVPPSVSSGFTQFELDGLTQESLCHFSTVYDMHPSRTIVFRRDPAQ